MITAFASGFDNMNVWDKVECPITRKYMNRHPISAILLRRFLEIFL